MLRRDHWQRQAAALDPERDFEEIARLLSFHEFPWDNQQALSLALFRTFAVPSIGGLLDRTGEFTTRTQKRYDDTGLLLEAVVEHGMDDPAGRTGIRRVNQMHAAYDIGNDDLRYVLATFVVEPVRWLERYGYRPLDPAEVVASTQYYRALGRMMNIKDLPADYKGFATLLDDYERTHFAFDPGGRRVADATLDLMATFRPFNLVPRRLARRIATCLMEDFLLDAFHYPHPTALERRLVVAGLRLRARLIRWMPARSRPKRPQDMGYFRSYPAGYRLEDLGTFPRGDDHEASGRCPFPATG